ncbi:MAG: GAF domain-containing protein [Ardenticatenales bacterium]|nr:GAF domain-containing protein [Ardenticatenales bacterium]
MSAQIYLLAPDADLLKRCKGAFDELNCPWQVIASVEEAVQIIQGPALLYFPMKTIKELALISPLRLQVPSVDVVVVAAKGSLEEATEVLRSGGTDYLYPPLSKEKLTQSVKRWQGRRATTNDTARLFQIIALMELGRTLTGTLHLDELYDQIIEQVQRAFVPDTVSLMLLNPQSERLRLVAQRGLSSNAVPGTEVTLEEGIAGKVVRDGEPQLLLGGLQGTIFEGMARRENDIGSAMSVPLNTQGNVLGVLNVNRYQGRPSYTENDATLLYIFAAQIAIAVQNAQLYESLREERDRIIQAQEEVRRELARDLHDGLTQVLAALAVNIGHLRTLVREERLNLEEVQEELEFLRSIARQAIHDARTLIYGLRPLVLETQGLVVALEHYLTTVRDGDKRTQYLFTHEGCSDVSHLAANVARMIFAILQEAINNARKHARAQVIQVELRCTGEGKHRIIETGVRDDGTGFNMSQVEKNYDQRYSFGLLNMRERATLIDGTFHMESSPSGTVVQLRVPWREGQKTE